MLFFTYKSSSIGPGLVFVPHPTLHPPSSSCSLYPVQPATLPPPPPPPHIHHSILSAGCQAQIRCLGRELECCPSPRWVGIQEAVCMPRRWNNRTGRGSKRDKKKKKKTIEKKNVDVKRECGTIKAPAARGTDRARIVWDTTESDRFPLWFLWCLFLKDRLSWRGNI